MRVRNTAGRNRGRAIAFELSAYQRDAHANGAAYMTQILSATRRHQSRAATALAVASALLFSSSMIAAAHAQSLGYAPADPSAFPQGYVNDGAAPQDEDSVLPERLRRQVVNFDTREAPGTIIIDTGNTYLYFVLGGGRAIRYGVGVGRQGFTWAGVQTISRKAEWPDWYPPSEMIARQPYLPRFVAGGPGNPLGARAMYLGSSEYRIHGTNDPTTIGKFVSSGCIRLTNEDVSDLFSRVNVGTKVVVLPKNASLQARGVGVQPASTVSRRLPPAGHEAMNNQASGTY
jgi:lipoprotein-anchoring transpeptidase ErfK/SrfK